MASSSRRSDYGEEFVERLRKDRFKKAYILVNGVSSEEEDEELDFDDEDDEIASYAMGPPPHQPPRPSSTHSSRRPPSIIYSQRGANSGGAYGFDARDLYFFGVLSELTDKFTPDRASRLIAKNPPPSEYRTLVSIERIAYLLYYSLYGRYLNVSKFHNIFNREFYKYTSAGDTERNAFLKICRHTLEEYKRRILEQNKRAYKMTQKHLFSDERATPDSRTSDRPSICADESLERESLDSLAKELMFYRAPHACVKFAAGGRIIYVDPNAGMSQVCIEDTKKFYKDSGGRRYVEMLECFKGPLLIGHTPPQTPLLFIQRQIDRILQSDVYRANPTSGDANDCLLIWHLLEMLVRQQGKVTGPDLARLLCSNQPYSSFSYQHFLYTKAETLRQNSNESFRDTDPQSMDRITRFLLGGHIEEAIESAINDGLFFDALLLAHKLFRNDPRRLEVIEARLMANRSAQHPITTLLSVAADMPVPLLNNPTTDDANGWRSHIAIVLANLQTQTAMNAVYNLGLALAQKEFNSAADFCFLAANLLAGYDCFQPFINNDLDQSKCRKHISLISATLPDDELNSCITRFGWSILDYQATEIYNYALQLGTSNIQTMLSNSDYYVQTRKQYAQLLNELGGFGYAVELYNNSVSETSYQSNRKTSSPPKPQQFINEYRKTSSPPKPQQFINEYRKTSSPPKPQQFINEYRKTSSPPKPQQLINEYRETSSPPTQQNELRGVGNVIDYNNSGRYYQNERRTSSPPKPQQSFGLQAEIKLSEDENPHAEPSQNQPMMMSYQFMNSGPFSNIPQDQKEIKLPDDKNSQIFYESHKGTWVDQEKKVEPVEEFPPPPMPFPPQQKQLDRQETTTPIADLGQEAMMSFAKTPILDKPQVAYKNIKAAVAQDQQNPKTMDSRPTDSSGGGFLRGRISGLFSKIKPQDQKEMKLPDDKNPKIVYDPQKGTWVDQEKKDEPVEELAPPPMTFPLQQKQPEQKQPDRQETSTPIADQGQEPMMSFPVLPIPDMPPVPTISKSSRPFQGKARYANAWNS